MLVITTNTSLVFSQPFTFFNKKVTIDESNQSIRATIPFDEGYYIVGISGIEDRFLHFAQLDKEGTVLNHHLLDTTDGLSGGNDFIETSDGHLAVLHGKFVSETNTKIVLVKFTKEGEILWIKHYGNEGFDSAGGVITTKDGGFAIVGTLQVGEQEIAIYTIKTDAEGEVEWENHYCLKRSCLGFTIAETINGGYILGGVSDTEDNADDMYIVKIDSIGNQIWEKNIGFGRNEPACRMYVLENENFLLEGGVRENNIKKNYYAKLDTEGDIIWEKKYVIGTHDATIQTPLVFREDGGFIGVSFKLTDDYITYPLIMNFDSSANLLWMKHITSDLFADNYVRDIDKIEGGYVLTGWKHNTPQHGWLVTIDEEGNFCEELGCVETVVDIENTEAQRHRGFLQISPNPVRGQATIEYQIPKEGVLKVYDYLGRLIDNRILDIGSSSLILEVGEWLSGVYLYSVEIEGERVEGGKLVVE
ncbi:MAG: T9SS type A sorting domain-containing protein [Chitinophagales bacterium]